MPQEPKSRYETAKVLQGSDPVNDHTVRFHAGAYKVGILRAREQSPEIILHFNLHCGKSIQIAISPKLAGHLATDILGKGELK